jgi:hypothetical protein
MDQISLYIKKYIFPGLIFISGLALLKMGIFSESGTNITQSSAFILGAIIICIMGVTTFLYLSDVISKKFHVIILGILLIGCFFLGKQTYDSVNNTIVQIELKKEINTHIKQGLRDIESIQIEYKKKFGWYSSNFAELKRFLVVDSVYSISTHGTVPDTKITPEHAEFLGYDPIQDYILIESYDEKEALACGLLTKDTSWINVQEKIFPAITDSVSNRIFEFNIDNLSFVPKSNKKIFTMKSDILETSDEINFDFVLLKNNTSNHFVSSNLVDFNGDFSEYYNKNIEGLIVLDSVPPIPALLDRDIIISANKIKLNHADKFYNIIAETKIKDTLEIEVSRNGNIITVNTFIKNIIPSKSRAALSDLYDQLYYNLSPALYNPKDFSNFSIPNNIVNREDEFSAPVLLITEFLTYFASRNGDTSTIKIENTMGEFKDLINNKDQNKSFHTFSKIGSPVFMAIDPNPYDPLNERDTLKTGSLSQVKTSGNWK